MCFLSQLPRLTSSSFLRHRAVTTFSNRRVHRKFASQSVCVQAPASYPSQVPQNERLVSADAAQILAAGMPIVVLQRGKARLFREDRNPLVFGGAVDRIIPAHPDKSPVNADAVAVCDGALNCIGLGFFNSDSMYRVRIMRHCNMGALPELPWDIEAEIVRKLERAVQVRNSAGIPCLGNEATNVYRLVNSEGDRLSGLMIDVMDNTVVVSSSAIWCERYQDVIMKAIEKVLPHCEEVIWRPNIERLRQEGFEYKSRRSDDGNPENANESEDVSEPSEDGITEVIESGVKYGLPTYAMRHGQKTGHYADQRENRSFLRNILSKRDVPTRVLDLFCYSGGFAMNAALAGPHVSITGVDSSAFAVEMAVRNAHLNGVSEQCTFIQSDVSKYTREQCEQEASFDVVIVDPPKYAPKAKSLPRAIHKYRSLNEASMRLVKPGGLLITCSCSAAMTRNRGQFVDVVRSAARAVGRELTLLRMAGAAPDHPLIPEMMESDYLTCCVFVVQ